MSRTDAAREHPWVAFALAFAAAWWLIDLALLRAGSPAPLDDAWEYLVAARHLLEGDGFRTSVIHPPIWGLRDAALTVPVLVHGPLLPMLLAPVVAVLGPQAHEAVACVAAAFALGAAALIARVVSRRAGPVAAGFCAVLFTISPLTVQAVHHDASCAIGAFFVVAGIAALESARARPALAGVLLGLGALVRSELLIAGLVVGIAARAGTRRAYFATWLAPLVAWAAYRGVTRMPWFNLSTYLLLADSARYPELTPLRSFDLTPDRFGPALRDAAFTLWGKWGHNLPRALWHAGSAPTLSTGWLAAVAVVMTLWRRLSRARRSAPPESSVEPPLPLRDLALMAIPIVLLIVAERRPALIVPFLPVWCWAVARGLVVLWRGRPVPLGAHAVLLIIAVAAGVSAMAREARESARARAWLDRDRVALAARYDPAAAATRRPLVFSDTPDFVAWSTGLPSVWITREELTRLIASSDGWPERLPRPGAGADTWFHEDPRSLR